SFRRCEVGDRRRDRESRGFPIEDGPRREQPGELSPLDVGVPIRPAIDAGQSTPDGLDVGSDGDFVCSDDGCVPVDVHGVLTDAPRAVHMRTQPTLMMLRAVAACLYEGSDRYLRLIDAIHNF